MDPMRRMLLKAVLAGAGGLGLRGVASAFPGAARSRSASTDPCNASILGAVDGLPTPDRPQRLILITGAAGDPLNANVPGCCDDPDIYHPPDMALRPARIGTTDWTCGGPWADLLDAVPALRDRICFFHHATYTVAHGDHAKVNALMGAIKRQEVLVSLLSKNIASCAPTPTTQPQPMVLSDVLIRYAGSTLPVLSTQGLSRVLVQPTGINLRMRQRRDDDLKLLDALHRRTGTPAQQAAVDRYAVAQDDARAMDPSLVGSIGGTNADGTGSQRFQEQKRLNSAAVSVLAMSMTPAVVMSYDFGGDNHSDDRLANENQAHVDSCAALGDLYTKLVFRGLQDDVTIVLMNVFGRTLNAANRSGGNRNGRDHHAGHHCTVVIGRGFKGSVIGGVIPTPSGNEFIASDIESATGRPVAGGDVPYLSTLASLGKTIGVGMGVARTVFEDQMTMGRVVEAALRKPPGV